MTDQATSTSQPKQVKSKDVLFGNVNLMASGGQQALDGWIRSNEAIMKGSFDLAQQILSFGQARLNDDLSALKTLMSCHDLGEMAECQKQFAEKAVAQYMDQANKLTSQLTGLLRSAAPTAPTSKV